MRSTTDGFAAANLRASASFARAQAARNASSPSSAIATPRFSNRSRTSARPWRLWWHLPIFGEEARDSRVVAEQRCSMDIAACDFGVQGEDFPRTIQGAV